MKKTVTLFLLLALVCSCFSMTTLATELSTTPMVEVIETSVAKEVLDEPMVVIPDEETEEESPAEEVLAEESPVVATTATTDEWIAISDLTGLKAIANDLDGKYYLTTNITISGWSPIGNATTPFTGEFDGGGYTLSNMSYYSLNDSYVGLFGSNAGTIKNVNVTIMSGSYVQGLSYVGVICGYNSGTISNCSASGAGSTSYVRASTSCSYLGGLVGYNATGGTITSCSVASVAVRCTYYISQYSTDYVGGLVGMNAGTIDASQVYNVNINAGSTSYGEYIGGFAGRSSGSVTNSGIYSTCAIYGGSYVAGFIGYNTGTIYNSYAIASGGINRSGSSSGTFTGYNSSSNNLTYCASSTSTSTKLLTSMDEGWSYVSGTSGRMVYTAPAVEEPDEPDEPDTPDTPEIPEGYEDWTAISTEAQLKSLTSSGNFYLVNDIALTSSWTPITAFYGELDGLGYTISGLTGTSSSTYRGLFGKNYGTISNLTLSVSGTFSGGGYTGALCGYNDGTIEDVYVTGGTVSGSGNEVGGFVGYNDGTIRRCSVELTKVSSSSLRVGGFVGSNRSTIEDSFATCATVSGTNYYIGGFAGHNTSNISNCYAYGASMVVSGGTSAGGFVGYNSGGFIQNCYNSLGTLSGSSTAYDCAIQGGTISNCYTVTLYSVNHFTKVSSIANLFNESLPTNKFVDGSDYDIAYNYPVLYWQVGLSDSEAEPATQFTVTFATGAVEADELPGSVTVDEGTVLNLGSVTATNYVFKGWSDGTTTYTTTYPVSGNITLVAQWAVDKDNNGTADSEEPCIVTYLPGLTDEIVTGYTSKTVDKNTVITLDTPVHENTDNWTYYVFTGWLLGEETLDAGAEYTVTENVEFTAQWEKITVNGDDIWDYLDAMSIMDFLGGITPTNFVEDLADRNDDGWIDYLDAMTIMDHMAD